MPVILTRWVASIPSSLARYTRHVPGEDRRPIRTEDVARLHRLAGVLARRASLLADTDKAWDETTALRFLPVLAELGVRLAER